MYIYICTLHMRNGVEFSPVSTVIPSDLKGRAKETGLKFSHVLVEALENKLKNVTDNG